MGVLSIHDIKEITYELKDTIEYYVLFLYREGDDDLNRYFLLFQSNRLEDVESYKNTWKLGDGEVFRTFKMDLPLR